jgi:hypothetical protein
VALLASLAVVECSEQAVEPRSPQEWPAVRLDIVSGQDQTGVPGTQLPNPLVVRVLDASGIPVKGQLVNFRVTEGGGSVFAGAALTSTNGLAQEWWTLGPAAGLNTVEVRAVDSETGEKLTFATYHAGGVFPPRRDSTATAVAIGMWASKAELDSRPMSGPEWTEMYEVATGNGWSANAIGISSDAGGAYMRDVMAAALVFARLKTADGALHEVADSLRWKITDAIAAVISLPPNPVVADTRPGRHLGGWAIIADLINLPAYDSAVDTRFKAWLNETLNYQWSDDPLQVLRTLRGAQLHNRGAMARWSSSAAAVYLHGSLSRIPELDAIAQVYRRWLGDTSIQTVPGEYAGGDPPSLFALPPEGPRTLGESASWQMEPAFIDHTSRVGVNALGATADGNNFDGVMPGDIYRGYYLTGDGTGDADEDPSFYRPDFFPNRANVSSFSYPEVTTYAHVGMLHILYRAGYTDLLTYQNSAQLRAIQWIHWAATNYSDRGWGYFGLGRGSPQEAAMPLIQYLWPEAGLPAARMRPQRTGSNYGYGWTWWLFSGRSIE